MYSVIVQKLQRQILFGNQVLYTIYISSVHMYNRSDHIPTVNIGETSVNFNGFWSSIAKYIVSESILNADVPNFGMSHTWKYLCI